jgi:hypothetical protein
MLPTTAAEFRSPAYWRNFFAARKGAAFEWYGAAADVLSVLAPAVPPAGARSLVVGCGNSALSEGLWAAGYKSTLSIDFDAGVVEEMRLKTGAACPGLEWAAADATTALDGGGAGFAEGSYSAVVDKGLLDALLPEEGSGEAEAGALRYLRGAARVLAPGAGALLVVSLLQAQVARLLLRAVAEQGGAWESAEVVPFESTGGGGGADLLAFCVLLRRSPAPWPAAAAAGAAAVPLRVRPLTFSPPAGRGGGGTGISVSAAEVLLRGDGSGDGAALAAVRDAQLAYALRGKLRRVTGGTYEKLDVWAGDGDGASVGAIAPAGSRPEALGLPLGAAPLYTVFVVDAPAEGGEPPPPPKGVYRAALAAPPQKFAVLLVPVGREHEWAFGSAAGQASLARRAGVARLLVVQLGSGAAAAARFARMTAGAVQAELSPVALAMLPPSAGAAAAAIPFLSVGGEPGSLARVVVAEGALSAEGSGGFTVEEVPAPCGGALRRLVFSSNRGALQSEVLRTAGGGVDPAAPLRFGYHRAMAAAVRALLAPGGGGGSARLPVLVLGLGGGALPSYLAATLPWAAVYAVEVDEAVARVASAHFGLPAAPGEPLRVAPSGEGGDDDGAAAALGAAFSPERQPAPGTVRVVLGDALRAVELLARGACPPAARPAAVLVDVNAGGGELRSGLSFPPRAFVSKVFLGALRAALRGGGGLLAMNLGARGAIKGAVLGAVARAFAADGPAAVVAAAPEEDEEEEEEEEGGDLNVVVLAGEPLQRLRSAGVEGYKPRGLSWVEA